MSPVLQRKNMPRSAPSSLPTMTRWDFNTPGAGLTREGGHTPQTAQRRREWPGMSTHRASVPQSRVLTQVHGKTKCILHKHGDAKLLGAIEIVQSRDRLLSKRSTRFCHGHVGAPNPEAALNVLLYLKKKTKKQKKKPNR